MTWEDADFSSGDPHDRYRAHQAAKGRRVTRWPDPDALRKADRENRPNRPDREPPAEDSAEDGA